MKFKIVRTRKDSGFWSESIKFKGSLSTQEISNLRLTSEEQNLLDHLGRGDAQAHEILEGLALIYRKNLGQGA